MTETIGNPLSWSVDHAQAVGKHLGAAATHIGHGDAGELEMPRIRHIAVRDLREVLRKGVEDFAACRTDVIFLCLLYPIIGALLAWVALHNNLLPLLFPITSGFALLGPIAAVGLYEMSRRREMGEEPDWSHALAFTKSPSFAAIFALGLMLGALFIVWVLTANGIYYATFGDARARLDRRLRQRRLHHPGRLDHDRRRHRRRRALRGAGARLQRDLLPAAPRPRRRAAGGGDHLDAVAAANPVPIAVWGLIVAAGLVIGSIPFFLGLIVIMPILGHATWHLYRRTVVAEPKRVVSREGKRLVAALGGA